MASPRNVVRRPTSVDRRVKHAITVLRFDNGVPITEIARLLNLSPSRFRHLFKTETGVSLRRYVKLYRLERAKDLLEHTFLRVKEISTAVGINDISHFVRDYKTVYGQTPSETRMFRGK